MTSITPSFGKNNLYRGGNLFISPGNFTDPASLQDGTLPIELLYFRAELKENVVSLKWATSMEENFDFFTIERSMDGMNFGNIAEIHSVGNIIEKQIYDQMGREYMVRSLSGQQETLDLPGGLRSIVHIVDKHQQSVEADRTIVPIY